MRAGRAALLLAALGTIGATGADDRRLFDAAPLLPAWLARLEIAIDISAESVSRDGIELRALELPLRVADGVLSIDHGRAAIAGGELDLKLRHAPASGTRVELRANDVVLGQIGDIGAYVTGVPVDLALDVEADGDSLRALAASADGRLRVENVANGMIRKSIERAGRSVLRNVFDAFNPYRSDRDVTVLDCLGVDLDITDGRIDTQEGVVLRTTRVRIAGSGRIDLGEETLVLAFEPQARSGIEIGGLQAVERVVLAGSLSAPEVRVEGGNLVSRAASLGASVATLGGTALVAALTARSARPGTLCPD